MLKIIIIFCFCFFLNYLNQLFVGCADGNRSSENFATMAKFDRPAALDPSATSRPYKKEGGGGGGGGGGGRAALIFSHVSTIPRPQP